MWQRLHLQTEDDYISHPYLNVSKHMLCVCVCICETVYLSLSSYQLSTAGALLQYSAAASEAECTADTMGNISQYFLHFVRVCMCVSDKERARERGGRGERERERESDSVRWRAEN